MSTFDSIDFTKANPNYEKELANLAEFRRQIADYMAGKVDDNAFRKVRLWNGIYKELNTYMQRVKAPYGAISSKQWRAFASVARKYARGWAHITTRQAIELHWVDIEDAADVLEELMPVNLTSREGCGDTVRNVTGDPLAGIAPDEVFDIRPYAQATKDYFMFRPSNQALGRKFKISFSGSAADRGLTHMHEIGYIAKMQDGKRGFEVYAGGGLGREPKVARKMLDFIPEEDLNACTAALLKLQNDHTNRQNRMRARMKFIVMEKGEAKFKEIFDADFAHFKAQKDEDLLRIKPGQYAKWFERAVPTSGGQVEQRNDPAYKAWLEGNVGAQKQPGLKWIHCLVELGDLTSEQMDRIAEIADKYTGGETRVTAAQNLILPFVRSEDVGAIYDLLKPLDLTRAAALTLTDVVACPGTEFCELSYGSSRGVARVIHKHFDANPNPALSHIRVRISGCPNSCGQHHIGNIGLIGFHDPKSTGEDYMYQILVGGGMADGRNELGRRLIGKAIPTSKIPEALSRIANYYMAGRSSGETFTAFFDRMGLEGFKANIDLKDLARGADA